MIDNNNINRLLILLLIDRRPTYKSSYVLIKVLSRMFGIFEYQEPIDFLIQNGFINREFINQIGHYTLTSTGKGFLYENKDELYRRLIELYSNEKEFIDALFSEDQ